MNRKKLKQVLLILDSKNVIGENRFLENNHNIENIVFGTNWNENFGRSSMFVKLISGEEYFFNTINISTLHHFLKSSYANAKDIEMRDISFPKAIFFTNFLPIFTTMIIREGENNFFIGKSLSFNIVVILFYAIILSVTYLYFTHTTRKIILAMKTMTKKNVKVNNFLMNGIIYYIATIIALITSYVLMIA